MPFLADQLWRNLVAGPCAGAPRSLFLAGWPEPSPALLDARLVEEIAEVRRVVELGRQARAASGLKLRQPLARLVVQGAAAAAAHADEIAEELRVKSVEFGPVDAVQVRVKPNLPLLGPKLGKALGDVRRALQEGRFEQLDGGRFSVEGHVLEPGEVLVERSAVEGWSLAEDDTATVAVATGLDEELLREGRVYDLIHTVNTMRKEQGLALTDRIRLTIPEADADLLAHAGWIEAETLAVEVAARGDAIAIAT